MRYREGRPDYREYDACFYEVLADMDEMDRLMNGGGDMEMEGNEGDTMEGDAMEGDNGGDNMDEMSGSGDDEPIDTDNLMLIVEVVKATEMNVFLYEGKSRHDAKVPLVPMNKMPMMNEKYAVPCDSGILVVAYPNKDVDTEF